VLAHLHLLNGDLDKAEARLREARDDPYREAWPVLGVASVFAEVEWALAKQADEQALTMADRLLIDLGRWGMRALMPHALYLRGLALEARGRDQVARECLAEARAEAEAIGSRRALWRILPALARLEADEAQAAAYRAEARAVGQFIADHIEDAALRASFLDTWTEASERTR
jgi:regulator of protease activity HflC (stomatin/prohibitin superfamily)